MCEKVCVLNHSLGGGGGALAAKTGFYLSSLILNFQANFLNNGSRQVCNIPGPTICTGRDKEKEKESVFPTSLHV